MSVLASLRTTLRVLCAVCLLFATPASFAFQASTSNTQLAQKSKALGQKEIQQRLKDLGFDPGPIDGTFGDRTAAALRAFQRKAGVPETGTVDDATMKELIASGEAKMLHSVPTALLPANTSLENFGTKIILRPAENRKGAIVVVIPRRGGYMHKLQFLGLTKDGRAHVESTVWTDGAIHEIDGPIHLAGFRFEPDAGKKLIFRVDRRKGYVFLSGDGQVTPPDGATMILGPYQQGISLGRPSLNAGPTGKQTPRK
jgi:peptidoglycan hydrolase-like protein with peptidoglycan-binding domain